MNPARSIAAAVALAACLGAVLLSAGCGGWQNSLRQSVAAGAEMGSSTADFVASLDEQKLDEIAAEAFRTHDIPAAEKQRADWLDKYKHARQALKAYAAAIAAARVAVELAIAGKSADIGKVLRGLLDAARALKASLASFGIEMPLGGLL